MTMMSRKGLLPEADFYHPVPYEPLAICTPEAVNRLIEAEGDTLLDRALRCSRQELPQADPAYAARIGLDDAPLEEFAERYFADRVGADPFEWAEANLAEARATTQAAITVPWRYAILRMHEVLALIVPHLDADELERFNRYLKPVFVDEYATVPHVSIERLLALHRAGQLDVAALGDEHQDRHAWRGIRCDRHRNGDRQHFPVFIEATGQRPLRD